MAIMKVVVLGETEVGKTSFTSRWTTGSFPDPARLRTTVGASFDTKTVKLSNGNSVTLSIWDFGGQQRFIESLKAMVRGAKIGLLFFDVSMLSTLDAIFGYWIPLIEENSNLRLREGDGERFILVGNKIDLIEKPFDHIEQEMKRLAEPYGMSTQLISAKTGLGIETLDFKFMELVEKYID